MARRTRIRQIKRPPREQAACIVSAGLKAGQSEERCILGADSRGQCRVRYRKAISTATNQSLPTIIGGRFALIQHPEWTTLHAAAHGAKGSTRDPNVSQCGL
jgi:hypothetical protein